MPAGDVDPVYSIDIRNRFDLIPSDINDDPNELIRAAQDKPRKEKEDAKAKARKDVKPAKTNEKKTVKIETPNDNDSSENRQNNDRQRSDRPRGRGGRGGRGRGGDRGRGRGGPRRGGFSPNSPGDQELGFNNNNYQSRDGFGKSHVTEIGEGPNSGFGGDSEERRGGRSGFRGRGRGGRGRGRGGGREFDRRSGSDKSSVKAVDKRDGSGSYNWGTPQDEINAASEEQQTGGFGVPKEGEDAPAESTDQTQETEEAQVEEVKDEGPQEITYEEYMKQLSETRTKPEYSVRKVDADKKGMKQLKKPTEEENEQSGSFFFPKKSFNETYKTSGRVNKTLNLDWNYKSGGSRHVDTNRRGGKGRRGPGGKKEDSNAKGSAEIALNDEEFPSLP